MTALRPFARPVVMLWLCAFALFLAAPLEAFAKRDMTNGNDSLEGDPIDGHEYDGGGSGDYSAGDTNSAAFFKQAPFFLPIIIVLNGTTPAILITSEYAPFVQRKNSANHGGLN